MTTATLTRTGFAALDSLRNVLSRFSATGLLSGYRAYLAYSDLASRTDSELAALNLRREDLPRIALDVMTETR